MIKINKSNKNNQLEAKVDQIITRVNSNKASKL